MFRKPSKHLVLLMSAALVAAPFLYGGAVEASTPFLGQIQAFGFNFPPRGWAHCDGQLMGISTNTALFSLLGTTYGGNGVQTFALPGLRGRTMVHPGTGAGLSSIDWGDRGGTETQVINVSNLPTHNHAATLHATSANGNQTGPTGHVLANDPREDQYSDATPNVTMNAACVTTSNAGGGQAFGVRDPYLAIYHSIALVGIFPSRN